MPHSSCAAPLLATRLLCTGRVSIGLFELNLFGVLGSIYMGSCQNYGPFVGTTYIYVYDIIYIYLFWGGTYPYISRLGFRVIGIEI